MSKLPPIKARVNNGDGKFSQVAVKWTPKGKPIAVPNTTSYFFRVQQDGKRIVIRRDTLDQILAARSNFANGPNLVQDFMEHAAEMEAERVHDSTLAAAIQVFTDETRANKSKETARKYAGALSVFRAFCNARSLVSVNQVTRQELLKFITYLRALQNGNGETRLSARSVHHHLLIATIFLKAAGRPKLLEKRDWPKYTEPPVKFYTVEEVKALRAAAAKMNHSGATQLLVDFLLGTGFRKGEARHATYSDVDFTGKVIHVTAKPQYSWEPKTCETRTVPIPDALVEALAQHKQSARTELIFPADDGRPVSRNTMTRWIKTVGEKAGIETDADCHTFRRTFGTMWAAKKPIHVVSKYMGHSSVETTLRYLGAASIRSAETRKDTAEVFEDVL